MRSVDVPQAPNLTKLRELIQAVAEGANTKVALERKGLLSTRHLGYYLHAARILGLLDTSIEPFAATVLGRQLLRTPRGQQSERDVFQRAIEASDFLAQAAPGLLDAEAPDRELLARRIAAMARIEMATARHRAADLLAWRRAILEPTNQLTLLQAPASSVPFEGVRDSGTKRVAPPSVLRLRDVTVERYGPLYSVTAPIQDLTVVVGANAAGKSSLFDVIQFISDALETNVVKAIQRRAPSIQDLLWYREGESFAFAFDFELPRDQVRVAGGRSLDRVRYELEVGILADGVIGVSKENLFLRPSALGVEGVCHRHAPAGWKTVITTASSGNARYQSERSNWKFPLHVGTTELALNRLPGDEEKFPIAHSVRNFFGHGVVSLALHSAAMRSSVAPWGADSRKFEPDGSNLPLLVQELAKAPKRLQAWIAHAQEALPALKTVEVVEKPENRELYLKVTYLDGLQLPSWRLSDGTLRILALTLIGFVAQDAGIFLIEEPENGIHPQAIEAVFQALSAGQGRQVLIATHSPVLVGIVPRDQILCVTNHAGKTEIMPGSRHPALKAWQKDADLSVLFATGLL